MNAGAIARNVLRGAALAATLIAVPPAAFAQATAEDGKGASTILLEYSSIGVNVADASIQIAFTPDNSNRPFFYGFKVKGKAKDGMASLVSKGSVSPGLEAGLTLGYKIGEGGDMIGLKAMMEAAKLTLFDPSAAPDDMIVGRTARTGEVGVLYNRILKAGSAPVGFGAVAATARRLNNYADLERTTVVRRNSTTLPDGTVQELVSETEAATGTLERGWSGSLDGDLIMSTIKLPMSVRAYVRLGVGGLETLRSTRTGVDVAFIKPGGDLLWDRLASLFVEHTRPAEDGKKGSWTIGLAASLPISVF